MEGRPNSWQQPVSRSYAVSTRPGNRTLRALFAIRKPVSTAIGPKLACRLSTESRSIKGLSSSSTADCTNPAARRANSERLSTPNLLKSVEMWNFTVRTVIFSFEAISLFARLLITECSTSLCRGLSDAGQATARPSSKSSCARETKRSISALSAGTMTSKSPGSCPRTRHCMASNPAILSTVQSKSTFEAARNCATPVLFSQKTNRLDEFASRFRCCCPNLGTTRNFFTLSLPVCLPRTAFGEASFVSAAIFERQVCVSVELRNFSGPREIVSFDLLRSRTAFPTAGPKRLRAWQVCCQRFSIP